MTQATVRTNYLNALINQTVDAGTLPWTQAERNQALDQALEELWPDFGLFVSGTVASNQNSPYYTLPASIALLSRIVLERVSSGITEQVGEVPAWTPHVGGQVAVHPPIATDTTVTLRFYGWKPFNSDYSDLPTNMQSLVAMKAASLCYGIISSKLTNQEDQMAMDVGKLVSQADAVGLSAYWQRRYEDRLPQLRKTSGVSFAPRAASRGS